ncbi:O-antigen ligase family protein [Candidatus Parcubacteria bacterium]|nr:O-antigen ligase family protein [Candidatus Parcubacteria bacterium]
MNTNKILKYIIYGAVFLVPFIPFIVPDFFFFPFITGKAFAFRIIVEIMVGAWAVLALRNPEYRPRKTWVTILATVFVGVIALADIFGVNPLKSIWSNFERMEGLVLMVHLLGFLFVTGSILNTEKLWHRFFNVSIIASVLMSFYGFLQMAGKITIHQGGVRLDATFGNSSYLAVYMLFHIFLTLFLLFRERKNSLIAWFYGLAIILQTIILYNTATRGALLGLVGGLIVSSLFVIIFEKENLVFRKICIGSFASFIILIGLFLGLKESNFVQNSPVLKRFADISLQEQTTKARFMVWNMAWQGFKEKPVLGWGQENFNYVFNEYYNPKMYDQEQWFDRTHNVFFDWLIAGGLLGLLGYLSLFWALIYYLIKDKNKNFSVTEKSIFIGMLAGYFIHNFFVFDHLISYILFFSFLGYIHSLNIDQEKESGIVDENVNKTAIPVLIILMIFSLYFFNVKGILTSKSLINALDPNKSTVVERFGSFKTALAYDYSKQEVSEQ